MILRFPADCCAHRGTQTRAQSKISELIFGLRFMISRQSTALYWFERPRAKSAWSGQRLLRVLILILPFYAIAQESAPDANLHGTIEDSKGKPADRANVSLRRKESDYCRTAITDSQGRYSFDKLPDGIYALDVVRKMNAGDEVQSRDPLILKPHESRALDLVLEVLQEGPELIKEDPSLAASAPRFFDQPQFTVAGVKDTTTLGGHGSDTVVRTRDSLAKETVSLGEAKPKESSDMAARADVQRLLATHETAELHHRLADLDEKLGDSLEAVNHYQRAAELDATEPYLFDWGAELLLHHASEPAAEVFSKGTRKFPNSARMLLGLGASSFARGNSDDAIREICQASDLNPQDPAPYLFLGKIEQSQIVPSDDLIEMLRRFVAQKPQNAEAHYYLAVGLWKQRNHVHTPQAHDQVENLLKQALQIDPKYAPAELQLGIVAADKRAYAEAISHYQRALADDPQLGEAHYRLAQAYRETGEADKAKEEVRIYEQLAKESAQQQDRERREIKQFVYTLRDQSAPQTH